MCHLHLEAVAVNPHYAVKGSLHTSETDQISGIFCNGWVNLLISTDWACISLAEDKTKSRKTHKQTTTEVSCSEGLARHQKGGNPVFGDVREFQTQGRHCLQRIFNNILKMNILFMIIFICTITFEPLKMGGLCILKFVIPKHFMLYFCLTPWLKLKVCTSITYWLFYSKSIVVVYKGKAQKLSQCPNTSRPDWMWRCHSPAA